jgi:RNA polymerase sigma-70 factor, ECF subfamily
MRNHLTIEQLSTEELVIEKAKEDPKNFEALYNQYFEKVFRFSYQRLENKEEASDITSQVFLKALINLKHFEYRSVPFSAWLFRIAINEINDYYKKSKKERMVNMEAAQLNGLLKESDFDLKEERINKILAALKQISGEDLLLIEMRFFEERSFKEIGDIFQITENNAKVKVYRILDKLKQKIS